jgi:hypothetical protein
VRGAACTFASDRPTVRPSARPPVRPSAYFTAPGN